MAKKNAETTEVETTEVETTEEETSTRGWSGTEWPVNHDTDLLENLRKAARKGDPMLAAYCVTSGEIIDGQLFTGRTSVGRAAVECDIEDNCHVYRSQLEGELEGDSELAEVHYLMRTGYAFVPKFADGLHVPALGDIFTVVYGEGENSIVYICRMIDYDSKRLQLTLDLSEAELMPVVPGLPERASSGNAAVDKTLKSFAEALGADQAYSITAKDATPLQRWRNWNYLNENFEDFTAEQPEKPEEGSIKRGRPKKSA